MSNLSILNFKGAAVRVVVVGGDPWWIAKDVCEVLGLKEPHRSVASLDDDDRHTVTAADSAGREQAMSAINESGLYSLILRSRRPEAKAFKKWITAEVLPRIRATGSYIAPGAAPTLADQLAPVMQMLAANLQALTGEAQFTKRVASEAAEMAAEAKRDVSKAAARLDAMQAVLDDRDKDQIQALRHAVDSIKTQVFREMIARGVSVAKVAHDFWTNVKARAGISSVKVESLTASSAQKLYAETLSQARIWGISVDAPLPIDFAGGV